MNSEQQSTGKGVRVCVCRLCKTETKGKSMALFIRPFVRLSFLRAVKYRKKEIVV